MFIILSQINLTHIIPSYFYKTPLKIIELSLNLQSNFFSSGSPTKILLFFNVKDQVSPPWKATGKITVSSMLSLCFWIEGWKTNVSEMMDRRIFQI
jgi:hypothetical protein